jgi:DNA ligase-1
MTASFSLMFACEPKDKHPLQFPGFASLKLDGIRAAVLHGRTWTRSSKEIPNKFTRARLNLCEGMDGEFIIGPPNAPDVFDLSSSAFRRIDGSPDFRVYAFDHIVHTNRSEDIVETRLKRLAVAIPEYNSVIRATFGDTVDRVILLPQRIVNNIEELEAFYEQALAQGCEGVIYKPLGKLYKHGRSTSLSQEQIKIKPLSDSEAIVLEVIEGKTNLNKAFINERGLQERSSHQENKIPSGMVGKLRCKDIYTGVEFLCSPGTMSHAMRAQVLLEKEKFTGAIFTYLFFPVGTYEKPRMNRFKGWRSIEDIDTTKAKFL